MSNAIKISPSIAALLIGISERSIRRAIKAQEIKAVVTNSRYKINLEDLLAWSNKLPNRQQKRDTLGFGQFVEKWKE